MKLFLLLLISATIVSAKPITLEEIVTHIKATHPQFQAKEQLQLSLEAQAQSNFASEPFALALSAANASPDAGEDAFEYSVGISKSFAFGDTKKLGLLAQQHNDEAAILEKERALIDLSNRIKDLYHQSCLDRENRRLIEASLESYRKLYTKKQKAYKFKEVSKKELLQLEMQMRTLQQEAKSSLSREKISQERLYDLSLIEKSTPLSCSDLQELTPEISYQKRAFSYSKSVFSKQMRALDFLEKRYAKSIDSIDIGASYDDEIDTKRVGVGIAVPLAFTSAKNEQNHLAIMHKKALKKLEYQNWMIEQQGRKKVLEGELKNSYNTLIMIEENLQLYHDSLMPLIEKSFKYGESSSLEYIFARAKLLELSQKRIRTKKDYYNRLFTLYSLLEMEN